MSVEKVKRNGAFKAPPPSPIATASGIKSAGINTEILNEYLETSLKIPELVLPEPLIKPDAPSLELPACDLADLRRGLDADRLCKSLAQFGCFRILHHGIPARVLETVEAAGERLFQLPPNIKNRICRSKERPFGFEEIAADDQRHETFWLLQNQLNFIDEELVKLWPDASLHFSVAVREYWAAMEAVAKEVTEILDRIIGLREHAAAMNEVVCSDHVGWSSVLCIYSHKGAYRPRSACLRHPCSHLFGVHHTGVQSDFYVYGDEGWSSLSIESASLIITAGNLLKVLSGGVCKSVIGRPVCSSEKEFISTELLYAPALSSFAERCEGLAYLAEHLLVVIGILFILRVFFLFAF